MDTSDWERALATLRAESDRVAQLRRQWSLHPTTPGWAGPTEQAAFAQWANGTSQLADLSLTLAQAEDECERRLEAARRAELAQATLL